MTFAFIRYRSTFYEQWYQCSGLNYCLSKLNSSKVGNILELSTVHVVTITNEGDVTNMSFVRSEKHNEYRHQTQGKKRE